MEFENISKRVLDMLFPEFCLNCGSEGSYACDECLRAMPLQGIMECPHCMKSSCCGYFCDDYDESVTCSEGYFFERLIFCAPYENIFMKKMITRYKYRFSQDLASALLDIMVRQFGGYFQWASENQWADTLIVPVPMHKKRLAQRGFNQVGTLAQALANVYDLQMRSSLKKLKYREKQGDLSREDRQKNLVGMIGLASKREFDFVCGKRIFLIDDVATTLSTLNECSKVLKEAGAGQIDCLVLARAH